MKFYPYEKGGGEKKIRHAVGGGHKKFWGRFYVVACFSHIEAILKEGAQKVFTLLKREARKDVNNDQSLSLHRALSCGLPWIPLQESSLKFNKHK